MPFSPPTLAHSEDFFVGGVGTFAPDVVGTLPPASVGTGSVVGTGDGSVVGVGVPGGVGVSVGFGSGVGVGVFVGFGVLVGVGVFVGFGVFVGVGVDVGVGVSVGSGVGVGVSVGTGVGVGVSVGSGEGVGVSVGITVGVGDGCSVYSVGVGPSSVPGDVTMHPHSSITAAAASIKTKISLLNRFISDKSFPLLSTGTRCSVFSHADTYILYHNVSLNANKKSAQIPPTKKKANRDQTPDSLSWATRIRTLKMTESESVALPFGDSPKALPFRQQSLLYTNPVKFASILRKILHIFSSVNF